MLKGDSCTHSDVTRGFFPHTLAIDPDTNEILLPVAVFDAL